MSNILQFFGKPYPIGSVINVPYTLNLHSKYTTTDGTEWVPLSQLASFNYTSDYAHLPNNLKSPWPLFPGPMSDGTWAVLTSNWNKVTGFSLAYRPSPELYVTNSVSFDPVTNSSVYYTSTDGSTWTKRNFENNGYVYGIIEYVGNKFIAYSPDVPIANAIAISTDGINWTSTNSNTAITTCFDIVANGTNNIVITSYGTTGTSIIYTVDGGANWLRGTKVSSNLSGFTQQGGSNGIGATTWNAGAGLFISVTTAKNTYQTSTNGAVWTSRTATFMDQYSTRFASNATLTVAVSGAGITARTTDGINWTNYSYLEDTSVAQTPSTTNLPWTAYYDGTRFVIRNPFYIWYSTDGISWTRIDYGQYSYFTSIQSNGVMFIPSCGTIIGQNFKVLKISNVAATSIQTVWIPPLENAMWRNSQDAFGIYRGQNQVVRIK